MQDEWLDPLEGLDVPPGGEIGTVKSMPTAAEPMPHLAAHGATALFLQCMCRLRPDYAPSDEEAGTIIAICWLLEGMPLGIELAASWTRTLVLADVQQEMARSLDSLTTSLRDVLARHRSMHAVFEHSWSLLTERERNILRQLAVFRGGCTRHAAEEVTDATLADLSLLVDKSWLRLQASGRYGMHALMRQYCQEKLETEHARAAGESALAVRQRHCRYFGADMGKTIPEVNFHSGEIDNLQLEFGNIRAAWQCIADTSDPQIASDLSLAFHFLGDTRGWFGLTIQILESGVKALKKWLAESQSDRKLGDGILRALGYCYNALVFQHIHLGMVKQARACSAQLNEYATMFSQTKDRGYWQALATVDLSSVLHFEGHFEVAYDNTLNALALFQKPGSHLSRLWPGTGQVVLAGQLLLHTGRRDQVCG